MPLKAALVDLVHNHLNNFKHKAKESNFHEPYERCKILWQLYIQDSLFISMETMILETG